MATARVRDQTEVMIVVLGVFRIAPEDRERYLAESLENQRISRGEPGCLEYVLAADPVEADRVVHSERWATRADLDAHLGALKARRAAAAASGATPLAPLDRDVSFLEADVVSM
jgi:quinol monooxygenase YgiN